MNHQSWKDRLLARSRQFWQRFFDFHQTESVEADLNSPQQFIDCYYCLLTPQPRQLPSSPNPNLFSLHFRTAELVLKQINIYYIPYRLESLLAYCDPFTAVGTFLNALNFSYETLIRDRQKRAICQSMFQEFMEIDQAHNLKQIAINEFPLYEAATNHDLEQFQATTFAFKRALDIIELLEQAKPPRYQKQQNQLRRFWHQKSNEALEKIVHRLTQ